MGIFPLSLLGRGNAFFGLGEVSLGGVTLRSARRPMFVEIRNPYGVELLQLLHDALRSLQREGSHFLLDGQRGGGTDGVDGARGASTLQHQLIGRSVQRRLRAPSWNWNSDP